MLIFFHYISLFSFFLITPTFLYFCFFIVIISPLLLFATFIIIIIIFIHYALLRHADFRHYISFLRLLYLPLCRYCYCHYTYYWCHLLLFHYYFHYIFYWYAFIIIIHFFAIMPDITPYADYYLIITLSHFHYYVFRHYAIIDIISCRLRFRYYITITFAANYALYLYYIS